MRSKDLVNNMIRIYVAGPYTADTPEKILANVNKAVDVGNQLLDLGFNVFVPHLSHYQHERKHQDYEKWLEIDFDWILACDCLLRLEGKSSGGDREVKYAEENNIPVFYSLKELLKELKKDELTEELIDTLYDFEKLKEGSSYRAKVVWQLDKYTTLNELEYISPEEHKYEVRFLDSQENRYLTPKTIDELDSIIHVLDLM